MSGQIFETDISAVLNTGKLRCRYEFQQIFWDYLSKTERQELQLKVPRSEHLMERHPQMHYHFKPEVFLQLRGITEFSLPGEKVVVEPGEMIIIPRGLPHGERIEPDLEGFRNVVVGFYSSVVSVHFAYEARPQSPDIEAIEFFYTPYLKQMVDQLDYLTRSYFVPAPARDGLVRSLTGSFLAMMVNLMAAENPQKGDSQRIFQVKWLVREQLYNPKLNVKFLARKLSCSADYLSHLFHKETGETLIHYINRQRIAGAIDALSDTNLSISEVAWSCGFADAGYFSRIFKRLTGTTPKDYRKVAGQHRQADESSPKTVYFDRVEFSPGEALANGRPLPVDDD
ncbi:MAG: Transcriptional regulator AraC family [Puniceicoccaceae bacterium 5H]|nr:MAG: Transcriptional regulator AraC family [Puniceicoccaceae bacterium 5H]